MSDIELSKPKTKRTSVRSLRLQDISIVDSLEGDDAIISDYLFYHSGETIDGEKIACGKVFVRQLILRGEESCCLEIYLTENDENDVPVRLLISVVNFTSDVNCQCSKVKNSAEKFYLIHQSDVYVYRCQNQGKRDVWVDKINEVIELGKKRLRSLQGLRKEEDYVNPIFNSIDCNDIGLKSRMEIVWSDPEMTNSFD